MREHTKFPDKQAEMYCKTCKYFKAENGELYDCTAPEYGNSAAATIVYDTIYCRRFREEAENANIEDIRNKIIPFGKYKGKTLKEAGSQYIRWLTMQEWLKMPLKLWVRAYYRYLYKEGAYDYVSFGGSCDPYDVCPFNGYNEMGYGELC